MGSKKKSSGKGKSKPKAVRIPSERQEVVVEETRRVERAQPVVVRREPATLARALAERVVVETPDTEVVETVETTEPQVERTVVRRRRRRAA
jgi:hypothetical protein